MNFGHYVDSVYGLQVGYAHNHYVELLFSLGIVGLVLYYLPYSIVFVKFLNLVKKGRNDGLSNYLILCIIALLILDVFTMGMRYVLQYLICSTAYYYVSICHQRRDLSSSQSL